jgi:hypothetical protein
MGPIPSTSITGQNILTRTTPLATTQTLKPAEPNDLPEGFNNLKERSCNGTDVSACWPREFCWSRGSRTRLDPSSKGKGVCAGMLCSDIRISEGSRTTNTCRPRQSCYHRLGPYMTLSASGLCLEAVSCSNTGCDKGWVCIDSFADGKICAPVDSDWDMVFWGYVQIPSFLDCRIKY